MVEEKIVIEIFQDTSVKTFSNLRSLMNDANFSNVTFRVENSIFTANKELLSKRCPYFEVMFGGNFEESENKSIELKLITANAFQQIMNFIYSGSLEVAMNEIERLWEAANFLEMEFISKKCVELVLEKKNDKLIDVFLSVKKHGQEEVANVLRTKMHSMIEKMSDSVEFLKLSADNLMDLFENRPQPQAHLFLNAAFKWILNRSPDDSDFERFPDILEKLILSSISISNLRSACQKNNLRPLMVKYPHVFGKLVVPLAYN